MRTRRLGASSPSAAGGAGAAPVAFPGLDFHDDRSSRRTFVSGSVAVLLHAGALAILFLAAAVAPVIEEEVIPVRLFKEKAAEKSDEPAPARKALAERRSVNFAPQAQAVQPQVVNPRVVAQAAPKVQAEALDFQAVAPTVAPKQIGRAAVRTERVSEVASVVAGSPTELQVEAGAPALRGPVEPNAPAGASVGPRQIVARGSTIGTGSASILPGGSSVSEGILSNRDVLGSPDGAPLADVNTRVGEGYLRGDGGRGEGVSFEECFQRSEVQAYLEQIKSRTYARWALPPGVAANQEVRIAFALDAGGSALDVKLVHAEDRALGSSAVDALRSASPFPPMREPVRCIAHHPMVFIFRNPVEG
jgi:hypothetical protein